MELNKIYNQDCLTGLQQLPDKSVFCCVTSPPYWGLRDYGVEGQHGLEETPEAFVARQVEVFREVKRVLRDDGTLWLNIGDSYASGARNTKPENTGDGVLGVNHRLSGAKQPNKITGDLKRKDLVGIPWMLAFALRADGWYLRQDIIWSKPNPMPESCQDRCTKSHEYIFLLSKSEKYYYNQDAIREPVSPNTHARLSQDIQNQVGSQRANGGTRPERPMKAVGAKVPTGWDAGPGDHRKIAGRYSDTGVGWGKATENAPGDNRLRPSRVKNNPSFDAAMAIMPEKRNKRSVWTITPQAFKEAHFATFPEKLPYTCILAGCPEGGVVIDPYMGAGTTAFVARKTGRNFIGFELNPEYLHIAQSRLIKELGMFI